MLQAQRQRVLLVSSALGGQAEPGWPRAVHISVPLLVLESRLRQVQLSFYRPVCI